MTATDRKHFKQHVRQLRSIATGKGPEDQRLMAVRSLAAMVLLQGEGHDGIGI